MEHMPELQIPQWRRKQDAVTAGTGCRLTRTDDLGRLYGARLRVYPQQDRQQAQSLCQSLDMAWILTGCANTACHREHWARQTEQGWEVCVLEAELPTLEDFCASRLASAEELILLPSDPQLARQALAQYQEKQRMPEETVLQIGCDICRALEQCREKGLESCAVTMQTVCVSPGGDFVLTGMGIAPGDRPAGTSGLARLLCGLLGGEDGKCAYGDEALRALVEHACAQDTDVKEFWSALDRIAHGEPEEVQQRRQIEELTEQLTHQQEAAAVLAQQSRNIRQQSEHMQSLLDSKLKDREDRIRQLEQELRGLTDMLASTEESKARMTSQLERQKSELEEHSQVRAKMEALESTWRSRLEDREKRIAQLEQQLKEQQTAASQSKAREEAQKMVGILSQLANQGGAGKQETSAKKDANPWSSAGDLSGKQPEPKKDYTAVIRQKMALSAVISAGDDHSVVLLNNGTAAASGKNINQQCNVGTWRGLQAVSAGDGHTVGLTTEGRVVAAGNNGYGQCTVGAWKDIVQVCAGYFHTVGLKADGTVVAAGKKDNDRCAVSAWKDIVSIAVGVDHTVGLKADGTVVATGSNKYGQCTVQTWRDIVQISAGAGHTVGLKADGTVVAEGWDHNNKCSVEAWRDIIAISAGIVHTVGLKRDGTVVTVGNTGAGRCDVNGWRDVAAVSAGKDHTVAVCVDGTVLTAGSNAQGQCDIGSHRNACVPGTRLQPPRESIGKSSGKDYSTLVRANADRSASVSAGHAFSACVLEDGSVQCTGNLINPRPWKAVKAVAVGSDFCLALRINGKVIAAGKNDRGQYQNVDKWDNIVQVAAGEHHAVGLCADGTVRVSGSNDQGQCNVTAWKEIAAVAAGYRHTVGLRADGTVVAVGDNRQGQCSVSGWKDIVAIAAGEEHTVGLRKDGTVVAVGGGWNAPQCAVAGWKNILAIDAGKDHTVGLKSDGTVVAAGRTAFNQCAVSRWKNIVAVSAGQCYTLGLRSDGSVVATGLNTNGQCRVTGWRKVKQPFGK